MKKICLLLVFAFASLFSFAQDKKSKPETVTLFPFVTPSVAEILYSPHLDSLVSKARIVKKNISKPNSYDFSSPVKLPDSTINTFSPKEKFIYAFKYPEAYSQNCSLYQFDIENAPFLHGSLPFTMSGYIASQRQFKILEDSRKATIYYLNDVIKTPGNIGSEYKHAIVRLKAFECLPALIHKYDTSKTKDNYILTTGMLLMKTDSFPPFIGTDIYKRFYGENGHWRDKMDLTDAVRITIIDLIDKYYKWKTAK